jgi:hypothetical protein
VPAQFIVPQTVILLWCRLDLPVAAVGEVVVVAAHVDTVSNCDGDAEVLVLDVLIGAEIAIPRMRYRVSPAT